LSDPVRGHVAAAFRLRGALLSGLLHRPKSFRQTPARCNALRRGNDCVIECLPRPPSTTGRARKKSRFQPFCKAHGGKSGIVATGIPAKFSLTFTTGFLRRNSGPFVSSIHRNHSD
jgi:hypothetical protein